MAGSRDTVGVKGSGFRLADFCTSNLYGKFDYFRITNVEYTATLANIPRQSVPNAIVYSSVDWDNADTTDFASIVARPNLAINCLTGTAPTQTLCSFKPRRRISSNVDPSQQRITPVDEWLDCAYAANFIFGNIKLGLLFPDGQTQYAVSDQGRILVTARINVEFKGRVGV
jgi:hypothetical protein